MKKLISSLAIFLPVMAFAQAGTPAVPEFNGVKVDSSAEYCIKQFVAKGFTLEKKDGVLVKMNGKLGTDDIDLYLVTTPGSKKVWKATILLDELPDWSSTKDKFNSLKEILEKKYGAETDDFHSFDSPYKEGDGNEMKAIEEDKCNYFVSWEITAKNTSIILEISKTQRIEINYENTINSAINRKEREKATSDGL